MRIKKENLNKYYRDSLINERHLRYESGIMGIEVTFTNNKDFDRLEDGELVLKRFMVYMEKKDFGTEGITQDYQEIYGNRAQIGILIDETYIKEFNQYYKDFKKAYNKLTK